MKFKQLFPTLTFAAIVVAGSCSPGQINQNQGTNAIKYGCPSGVDATNIPLQTASTQPGIQGSLIDLNEAIGLIDSSQPINNEIEGSNYFVDPAVFANYGIEACKQHKTISSFKIGVVKNEDGTHRMVVMAIDEKGFYIPVNGNSAYEHISPCPQSCPDITMQGHLLPH